MQTRRRPYLWVFGRAAAGKWYIGEHVAMAEHPAACRWSKLHWRAELNSPIGRKIKNRDFLKRKRQSICMLEGLLWRLKPLGAGCRESSLESWHSASAGCWGWARSQTAWEWRDAGDPERCGPSVSGTSPGCWRWKPKCRLSISTHSLWKIHLVQTIYSLRRCENLLVLFVTSRRDGSNSASKELYFNGLLELWRVWAQHSRKKPLQVCQHKQPLIHNTPNGWSVELFIEMDSTCSH